MKTINNIRCIIVDDEPLARNVLVNYAEQIAQLEVVGTCANAIEAFEIIQKEEVQLVFLDIKMPKLNGLELLESISNPPLVVFTTAYRDYAIRAFELNAIDYLLKPIALSRFLQTIAKANKYLYGHKLEDSPTVVDNDIVKHAKDKQEEFIYIKSDRKVIKLILNDILFLESLNDKVTVHLKEKEIITTQRISYLLEKLPQARFIRIHRSFIIAIQKINAFNNIMVEIGERELPIGRNYRAQALEVLRK